MSARADVLFAAALVRMFRNEMVAGLARCAQLDGLRGRAVIAARGFFVRSFVCANPRSAFLPRQRGSEFARTLRETLSLAQDARSEFLIVTTNAMLTRFHTPRIHRWGAVVARARRNASLSDQLVAAGGAISTALGKRGAAHRLGGAVIAETDGFAILFCRSCRNNACCFADEHALSTRNFFERNERLQFFRSLLQEHCTAVPVAHDAVPGGTRRPARSFRFRFWNAAAFDQFEALVAGSTECRAVLRAQTPARRTSAAHVCGVGVEELLHVLVLPIQVFLVDEGGIRCVFLVGKP